MNIVRRKFFPHSCMRKYIAHFCDEFSTWRNGFLNVLHRELNPDMVTHPTTNRARRRLTMLIETNAPPLHSTQVKGMFQRNPQ